MLKSEKLCSSTSTLILYGDLLLGPVLLQPDPHAHWHGSFHEDHPPALVRLQTQHWEPLIARIEQEYGIQINIIKSLFGAGQPAATKRILGAVIEDFDEWELAGEC